MQSWHWTGIAIGLAQTIGLHRDPDAKKKNSSISDGQRQLWRRLWWMCVFRDCWLALGMGRPMRISLEDCDSPLPAATDVLKEFESASNAGSLYSVQDACELAKQWISLLELSISMREVLLLKYRPNVSPPTSRQLNDLAARMKRCVSLTAGGQEASKVVGVSLRHLRLHQQ